jgi:hypothetical protein
MKNEWMNGVLQKNEFGLSIIHAVSKYGLGVPF